MDQCKNCRKDVPEGCLMECPNCGAVMCSECAKTTKRICPYCYSDLEYIG